MKKYYVALPFVMVWSILVLIAIAGFIWETIDVGKFVFFAFLTSILIPVVLEIILILLYCQYIRINESGVRKYLLNRKLTEYKWEDIKEVRVDVGMIYISLEPLIGEKNQWNNKKYIYIMYSDKVRDELKKYILDGIIVNF